MKKIDIAPFWRRLLAAIMDMSFFALLFVLLMMLVMNPIVNSTMGYQSEMLRGYQYQTASHLYVLRQVIDVSTGEERIIEVKDYTEQIKSGGETTISSINLVDKENIYYLKHVKYYYCNYLTGKDIDLPNDTETKHYDMVLDNFVSPNYDKEMEVDGVKVLPINYYTDEWFNNNILSFGKEDQIYELDGENNYVIKQSYINAHTDASKSEEENQKTIDSAVKNYLKVIVYNAQGHLYYQDYYQSVNHNVTVAQYVEALIPFFFSLAVVYLLFPLIFKDGETLGKITMKVGLVNKNGYQVSKGQVVLRFLFFTLEIALSTFVIGFGFTSIATLGLGIFVLLILTLVNKNKRALHDFVSGTLVIDKRTSVFFKNKDEEDRFTKEVDEETNRIKSIEVENPHIIQVGDQIIDENIKKEIEEKK